MGVRYYFVFGVFESTKTISDIVQCFRLLKSPYENADFYIEHLFSFLLHNPDLFFISFQNFSFADKHNSFFLYNYYENYGILDNDSNYIHFHWNTFFNENTVFRSLGLGSRSGKYNLLLKSSSQSLTSTLTELFLDDEFLNNAESNLEFRNSRIRFCYI